MKKIFFCLILINLFIIKVNASDIINNFHLTDKVVGSYITRYDSLNFRNGAIYMIKDSNNNLVYCIEPFQPNLDSSSYDGYYNNYNLFNLTQEQINKINLYAYYGYGYNNQLESKWYIITQALIWRELGVSTYFTSVYHGEKVDMYESEMQSIINNVRNHYIKPNFNENYDIGINEELELIDLNNVLENYEVEYDSNLIVEKNENILKIISQKPGLYKIKLVKKDKIKNNTKTLFYNNNSQNVFLPGKFDDVEEYININIHSGSLTINTSSNKQNIKGAKYNLYNLNNELINTYVSDEFGNIYLENLDLNTYYVKQIDNELNYEVDNNIYEISLTIECPNKELKIINELVLEQDKLSNEKENLKEELFDKNNEQIKENLSDTNNDLNNTSVINVPNTYSSNINISSILSIIFIILGLGVIILYAKKQ